MAQAKCTKCGGQGQSSAWQFTGSVCFRCGGTGIDPKLTVEQAKKKFEIDEQRKAEMIEQQRITSEANKKKRAEDKLQYEKDFKEARKVWATKPHPNEYFAGKGKTLDDYYQYFIEQDRLNGKNQFKITHAVWHTLNNN